MEALGEKGQPGKRQERLCPFRVRTVRNKDGGSSQWFITCLGEKCMSYQDGTCSRGENRK